MPKEAETATRIAVAGEPSKLIASGMSIVAVAVLLINADSSALAKQNVNINTECGIFDNGNDAATTLMRPDC